MTDFLLTIEDEYGYPPGALYSVHTENGEYLYDAAEKICSNEQKRGSDQASSLDTNIAKFRKQLFEVLNKDNSDRKALLSIIRAQWTAQNQAKELADVLLKQTGQTTMDQTLQANLVKQINATLVEDFNLNDLSKDII